MVPSALRISRRGKSAGRQRRKEAEGDPQAGERFVAASGGPDRAGIRLRYYSACGCEPGRNLLDRVVMIRRDRLHRNLVRLCRLSDCVITFSLNPNRYIIEIKGIQVTEGEILFDPLYMAMNPGYVEEEITGIPTFEPSFHLPAILDHGGSRERRARALAIRWWIHRQSFTTHLTEVIRSHIAGCLPDRMYENLVNNLKESSPVLVDELVPKLLGLGEIQEGSAESALGGNFHPEICS